CCDGCGGSGCERYCSSCGLCCGRCCDGCGGSGCERYCSSCGLC
ncbi:unnamed protein product, partial [Rotaria sp. Silwood1]